MGLAAQAGDGQVILSWNAVAGATSYIVYRSSSNPVVLSNATMIAGVHSPYTDTGLTNGIAYYYAVVAVNSAGESPESITVGATPQVAAAGAPTGLVAMSGDTQVSLTWNAVTGAGSYNLYWSTTSGVTVANGTKISGVSSPYSHTGLTNGVTYHYIVTAVVDGVESAASSEASTTAQAPIARLIAMGDGGGVDGRLLVGWTDGTLSVSGSHQYLDNAGNDYVISPFSNISGIASLAMGAHAHYVLKTDGTVWSIGSNSSGQLGLGDLTDRTSFTQVPGLANIKKVSASGDTVFALATDGTLYAAGWNNYGQTGVPTAIATEFESFTISATGVADVGAGYYTCAMVKTDGSAWVSGSGFTDGWSSVVDNTTAALGGIVQAASGFGYFVFVDSKGELWYLGNSPFGSASSATKLPGFSGAKALFAGSDNVCPILLVQKTDDTLWYAGSNQFQFYNDAIWSYGVGLIGTGDTSSTSFSTLTQVASNVLTASAGENQWGLIKNDGTIWVVGANSAGEQGAGSSPPYYNNVLTQVSQVVGIP